MTTMLSSALRFDNLTASRPFRIIVPSETEADLPRKA